VQAQKHQLVLDRLFGLAKAGTDLRTEFVAGMTTFLTMIYIISNQDDLLDRPRQSARRRRRQCAAATLPGLITPQPTRNGDMRPCTGRSKLRGTSGTRSGK
jgi:hypothetical protein